ncbi:MAG: alpha/beta fold hydrolase [Acidobacteriota bacterium]
MAAPLMRRVKSHRVEIQLAVWPGQGRNVLCVHGLTANCRCWDTIAGALSPEHRVSAMDLRGRGLSGRPRSGYSIERHCRDIDGVMKGLGMEQVTLVGHSLGAIIALAFAARFPQRVERLVLIDGGGKLTEEQATRVFAGIKPALDRLGHVFPSMEAYLGLLKAAPFLNPWSEAIEAYFRYEAEEVKRGVRSRVRPAHVREELINLREVDIAGLYPAVSCPTLILRATDGLLAADDILLPREAADRMLREIPDARCVDVEGANHYSIVFQPNARRDRELLAFLE